MDFPSPLTFIFELFTWLAAVFAFVAGWLIG